MTPIRIYYEDDFQLGVKFGGIAMSLGADFDIIISCGGQQYRAWRKDGVCYNCTASVITTMPKLDDIPIYDFVAASIPVKNHGLGIGRLTIDVGVWIADSDATPAQIWETLNPNVELVEVDPNMEIGTDGALVVTVEVNPNNEHNSSIDITNVASKNELHAAIIESTVIKATEARRGDLEIADESGNVVVRFLDGHIVTKNFDSRDSASPKIGVIFE